MSKKVQYAIGAVGLLPALGLLAQPAAGASAHASTTSGKRVNANATCYGHTEHHAIHNHVSLTFWSARVGSRICVGTMEITNLPGVGGVASVGTSVLNHYGTFCAKTTEGDFSTNVCRRVFRTNGLRVRAFSASLFGPRNYFSVPL
jgi:hypothetical protein